MNKFKTIKVFLFFIVLIGCGNMLMVNIENSSAPNIVPLGKASTTALNRVYQQWKHNYQAQGGNQFLTIPLQFVTQDFGSSKKSNSQIKINLQTGYFTVFAQGLASDQSYDLWLQGRSKGKEEQARSLFLGQLEATDHTFHLQSALSRAEMQGMYLDRIEISLTSTVDNKKLMLLLTGSPSLFQKIFYRDQYNAMTQLEFATAEIDSHPFLFISSAFAKSEYDSLAAIFTEQIEKGRDLFINETFEGNGRTCQTCHRLDNNHTIDPKYIAQLPDDDPLFVAETNPQLAELERPKLLRQFGLILSNLDGFDKPGVLRGVSHLLALSTSITPEADHEGAFVKHALGWSADGSPNDGSLRMFTVGAVKQHMPKTMNREEGVDFRLPTDEELDALEAYMLSLGRSVDYDLDAMYFSSPIVQKGRELFHSKEPGTGQCKGCHLNAGANSSSSLQNGNRDTGVENMPNNLLKMVWKSTPNDGGFGRDERHDCGWKQSFPCYGNQEFNMTTVVEAADTAPYFHNNSVNTIEEAVAFYNSNAFHNSPGANPADPNDPESVCERCIHLEPTEVTAIALFLRTLNAIENIRSSNELDLQASQLRKHLRNDFLQLAIAETEDALEVLEGGAIIPNPKSVKLLREAITYEQEALHTRYKSNAIRLIAQAIKTKQVASDLLLTEPPDDE